MSLDNNRINDLLKEMVDKQFVSGASVAVIKDGEEIFYGDSGVRDMNKKTPFSRDTICRMYSMSKPVTAVAAMILFERGVIDWFDPVEKFLPGIKGVKVATESGKLEPLTQWECVTVGQLLNMTSGIAYPGPTLKGEKRTADIIDKEIKLIQKGKGRSTQELMNDICTSPLNFHPGATWQYGFSADVLGAVIEVASGMKFSDFLKENIFKPLGMNDTDFWVPEEKYHRLADVYRQTENGLNIDETYNLAINYKMNVPPAFESGGAGLASCVDDYIKFAKMLLGKGTLNGVQILKPATVEYMSGGALNDRQRQGLWDSLSGHTYGNLLRVLEKPSQAPSMGSIGEYGWDGWLGTYLAICPNDNMAIIMMMQRCDTGTSDYTRRIRNVIFSSLS